MPVEAETLQKPAEKTTMEEEEEEEEETNKFTNYKCETSLQACTMQEVRICQKTGKGGRIRKKTLKRKKRVCAMEWRETPQSEKQGRGNMAIYEMSKQH